jgi:hypothetical protein
MNTPKSNPGIDYKNKTRVRRSEKSCWFLELAKLTYRRLDSLEHKTVDRAYVNPTCGVTQVEAMENEENHDRSDVRHIRRPGRLVSRTRLIMGLLLIVAIPIFVFLANKAVHENAAAIQKVFGR